MNQSNTHTRVCVCVCVCVCRTHLYIRRQIERDLGYWSTAHVRFRGLVLGLATVSMHVVSPWNRPFVTLLLIWLVAGYFPCALSILWVPDHPLTVRNKYVTQKAEANKKVPFDSTAPHHSQQLRLTRSHYDYGYS